MNTRNLLIPRAGDELIVAASWEQFVQDMTPQQPQGVRNVILESWLRCRSTAVNPSCHSAPTLGQSELLQLREHSHELYDAAQPVMTMLRDVLYESGSLILLSDATGAILDLNGDTRTRDAGEQVNLTPGGCWIESQIGTNAIGTALATHAPVQIYASEHYCIDVKHWTCAAAPILDPLTRTILGVIDVSGVKNTFHGHSLGLVITAAQQIESILARRAQMLSEQLLAESADLFTRYANDAVVLFDQHGRVLKDNNKLLQVQAQYGVRLPLGNRTQLASVNLTLPESERQLQAPAWLKPEWVTPIRVGGKRLGSALIIPLSAKTVHLSIPPRPAVPSKNDAFADIIGSSQILESMKVRARRLALLDLPVMLLGETGVGKEIFAKAIHKTGMRPVAPFVAVNCGAFTRELLASELFGYAEGAFTGARRGGAPGKFEQADGGTLFLDEVGEMPLDMQPHLLRVLQDGMLVRLGDSRERPVSVRIIAATNRDLLAEVKKGRFREDLYHRLCVTTLQLPPLRARREDITEIIAHLNLKFAQKYGLPPKALSPAVRHALLNHSWPGNIRELKNVFEALFALSEGDTIDAAMLPDDIAQNINAPVSITPPAANLASPVTGRLDEMEKQAIQTAIHNANGNISMAARQLGISRSTLYVKLSAIKDGLLAINKRY